MAQNFRSKVTLLYCVEYIPPLVEMPVGGDFSAYLYRAIEEAPDRAREKFEELRQEDLQGVDMELHVAKGTPFKEILSHASDEEADLIVMATHGWTGLKHFLLGSITEKIIHKAPCSVLTIRSPDEGS